MVAVGTVEAARAAAAGEVMAAVGGAVGAWEVGAGVAGQGVEEAQAGASQVALAQREAYGVE